MKTKAISGKILKLAIFLTLLILIASGPAFAGLETDKGQTGSRGTTEAGQGGGTAYYRRGNAHYDLGDMEEAIRDYSMAITLNPMFAEAYNGRGLANHALGNMPQAIVDYSRAIAINPKFGEAYYNRGLAYSGYGIMTQAMRDYGKAVAALREYGFGLKVSARGRTETS